MARKNSDAAARAASGGGLNPRWWVPTALGLMLLGLVWVMTYYISSGAYPIPNVDAINIVVGFAFIMVGFIMMTRWK
ncbi:MULTISPECIES: cell division protein CrgA [Dermacoccus]|uniref:Cell division protein CrgA n=3 Tax=Dermacoccus TaxID=57495 RepID=A0ABX5ZF86_9MICO|nr:MULTISPECIES: cell division protein CrgA [Dermacoccus]MBZ4498260.1 cell division protein CrgA [Dermacoccus sp. Tok2021]KLO63914.1 septation inhibitor protein [Dermacoccus sp. PE3]MCT1988065.1 cell division protein CrgA [Dermacoccus abyssi]QEH94510.1 cell division protein CrgA [Dermacoccus abyssi]QNK53309.1 cell division protein CrgA [Dermacoccus sp. PAMC28757]